MAVYCGRLTIVSGRFERRQRVTIARNIEADDRTDATFKLTAWAEELGLSGFMAGEDVRLAFDVVFGAGDPTGV